MFMDRMCWHKIIYASIFICSSLFAGQPLLTIAAVYKAPSTLARNSFTAAVYQVTNNSKTISSFAMKSIPGVTQVTSFAGACGNPIALNFGQSCQLYLRVTGSQVGSAIKGGPVICNNVPNPLACSQPSISDVINLTTTPVKTQNNWISVLVAQDEPPTDLATYLNQIIALAPGMTQVHFRVPPGATNYSFYANAINLFRTAYPARLLIGFHPDNSSGSYSGWGCGTPADNHWQCVLNESIKTMNAMNALVDPQQTGQGFNIFSLEQSYVEIANATAQQFADVKNCLNPSVGTAGTCPICTTCSPQQAYASPVVTFGNVSQSFGAGIYGPTMLDFAYPQFYNLGKHLTPYESLFTNGYFPTYSTACISNLTNLTVVDIDSNSAYAPEIPCLAAGQTAPNIYTYPDPTTQTANPSLVAAYMAYLMTQLPPIAVTIPLDGSTAYITFSGEPEIFGSPGWAPTLLSQFYTDLNNNFSLLKGMNLSPPLFPSGGTDPSTLQYAIWNFSSMLGQ